MAHAALDFGWAEAFVLGAIVSPTDPVAATAIARRLRVPGRIVTIVEGESLINDGTALVAYKFAVAAVVTGSFSVVDASVDFVVSVAGGIAIGIAFGAVIAWVRSRLDNPPVEITIALFSAYFAYLPAEAVGVSGVLAAVTVGIYMGRLTSRLTTPTTRIQNFAVWEIVTFLLNSALFVLVGLQLPTVVEGIGGLDSGTLIRDGLLVAFTVMAVRVAWVFPLTYLPRMVSHKIREREASPSWQNTLIVAWTGMRGAVSLAAALALPLAVDGGADFPNRDLILYLTFSVILVTLLLQGLTLPPLIKMLGVDDRDETLVREENEARLAATPRQRCLASTSSTRRSGCSTAPSTACAAHTNTASGASPRACLTVSSTAASTATASTTRSAAPRTSGWFARCSRPSARRWRNCAAPARSTTRYCDGFSASSTSRIRAWRSERAGAEPNVAPSTWKVQTLVQRRRSECAKLRTRTRCSHLGVPRWE